MGTAFLLPTQSVVYMLLQSLACGGYPDVGSYWEPIVHSLTTLREQNTGKGEISVSSRTWNVCMSESPFFKLIITKGLINKWISKETIKWINIQNTQTKQTEE